MSLNNLIFRNHKVYVAANNRDVEEKEVETLIFHLQSTIKEITNFTFGDLLSYVGRDKEFFQTVFAEAMGNYPLEPYLKDLSLPYDPAEDDEAMAKVNIGWCGEIWDWTEAKTEELRATGRELSFYADMGCESVKGEPYGIGFGSLSQLAHCELVLDPEVSIRIHQREGASGGPIFEDFDAGKHEFSLYEILDCILDEITFYGTPKDKLGVSASLDQSMAEAKDAIASGDMSKFTELDFGQNEAD